MTDAGPAAPSPDEGRTQTGRAVVLVIVVALIAVVLLRHTGSSVAGSVPPARAPTTTTTPTTVVGPAVAPTTTLPLIAPAETTVEVLNGLQAGSLAGNLSGRLRADGYKTLAPDNTTTLVTTSVIYVVQPAYRTNATKLASTLGVPGIEIHTGLPSTAPVPAGVATGSDLIVVIGTTLQPLAAQSVTPATIPAAAATSTTTATTSTSATTTRSTPTTVPTTTTARSATTAHGATTTIAAPRSHAAAAPSPAKTAPPTTVPSTTVPSTTVPSTTRSAGTSQTAGRASR